MRSETNHANATVCVGIWNDKMQSRKCNCVNPSTTAGINNSLVLTSINRAPDRNVISGRYGANVCKIVPGPMIAADTTRSNVPVWGSTATSNSWSAKNSPSTLALPCSSLPWNWFGVSLNPNITFDNVLAHPDKPWSWKHFSANTFSKAKQRFINKKYKEYLSAYRIQQCWNRAISIPTNPICKRKQIRDYEKCTGRSFC